jgi:hypothetical protein
VTDVWVGLVFVVSIVLLVHTVTVVRTARSNFSRTWDRQLAVVLTRIVVFAGPAISSRLLVMLTLLTLSIFLALHTCLVMLALFAILVVHVILAIRDDGAGWLVIRDCHLNGYS